MSGPGGKHPRASQRRGGYVMVLFAMLLFGIMAMAALVIDIGIARLTQRQMQTAADSAALEGLRFRDDQESNDREVARRERTRQMAGWMYGEGAPNGDTDSINFGATAMAEFSGSAGDPEMFASQLMTIPDEPVYMPSGGSGLQFNWDGSTSSGDNVNGDMVAGNYHTEPPPGASSDAIRDFHKESINELTSDYERSDFERADSSLGEAGNAFMVRMRRTGEIFEQDVRSAGPPLPYLFGWGSTLPRIRSPEQPRVIADGIKVRATGIAAARNVTVAGPAFADESIPGFAGMPGVTPFCVDVELWPLDNNKFQMSPGGEFSTFTGNEDSVERKAGRLFRITQLTAELSDSATALSVQSRTGFPSTPPFRIRLGRELMTVIRIENNTWTIVRNSTTSQTKSHVVGTPVLLHQSLSIGTKLTGFGSNTCTEPIAADHLIHELGLLDTNLHRYVPLYSDALNMVVGFGILDSWEWDGDSNMLSIFPASGRVAANNATAGFGHVECVTSELLHKHRSIPESLLAPVLVR